MQNSHTSLDKRGDPTETLDAKNKPFDREIIWHRVAMLSIAQTAALYGLFLCFTKALWLTVLFGIMLHFLAGFGVTAGAHRLWSHRSYKVKRPLSILLCMFNTISLQEDVIKFALMHRVHHKYSDTDADFYPAHRGFFFAHCGWLMCTQHPDLVASQKTVSLDDLLSDPVLSFQRKYYTPLAAILCFILPTLIPMYFWNETFINAFFICVALRHNLTLHSAWTINSLAHLWGERQYDKHIYPANNKYLHYPLIGEGSHNFHHAFPWDYASSEFGAMFSLTTSFIDFFAKIGWAYDLKTASKSVVKERRDKYGYYEDDEDYKGLSP